MKTRCLHQDTKPLRGIYMGKQTPTVSVVLSACRKEMERYRNERNVFRCKYLDLKERCAKFSLLLLLINMYLITKFHDYVVQFLTSSS